MKNWLPTFQMNTRKGVLLPVFYLFLATLIFHGLTLFNNGIFSDGWIGYIIFIEHNFVWMKAVDSAMGLPIDYYIDWVSMLLGYGFIINLTGFLSVFIASLCVYLSLRLFKSISSSIALLAAYVVIIYPGALTTFFGDVNNNHVCYILFFVASYFGLKSQSIGQYNIFSIALRVGSLLLFFISFFLKSLLCYYAVFFAALYCLSIRDQKILSFRANMKFLLRTLDFFILPFLFFVIVSVFFPAHGVYAGYNTIAFPGYFLFIYWHLHSFFNIIFFSWVVDCLYVLFLIAGVVWVLLKQIPVSVIMNLMKRPLTDKWFFPYGVLLIVGFVALWMAVFPYIMVHIVVDSTRAIGTSHYSLLVPSAMAILFAGIWGLWFQNSDGRITSVGKIIFVALALVYGIFWYRGYLQLSAESALQKTLIKQFQKHPGWGNYSIYWIRIYFDGVQPVYSGYEWSGILSYVYGGHSRYGESYKSRQTYNSVYWDKTFTPLVRQLYNIEKWDENGCQATIKIIPLSEGKNPYVIGSLYLYYRLLDKKQLSSFLDHLMQVEVRPYQSIEATHCKKV